MFRVKGQLHPENWPSMLLFEPPASVRLYRVSCLRDIGRIPSTVAFDVVALQAARDGDWRTVRVRDALTWKATRTAIGDNWNVSANLDDYGVFSLVLITSSYAAVVRKRDIIYYILMMLSKLPILFQILDCRADARLETLEEVCLATSVTWVGVTSEQLFAGDSDILVPIS